MVSPASGAESFIPLPHHDLHRLDGFCQILSRIELTAMGGEVLADRRRRGKAQVRVDVHLAHAVTDARTNFLERHAIGFWNLAAVCIDLGKKVLRHGGAAMHDQVRVRDALVDRADAIDGQNIARWRTAELVGAMGGADRDREGIDAGLLDEIGGLLRIRQQHVMGERSLRAHTVFFSGGAGFQRTQATELALHRHAARVRHLHRAPSDFDVVLIACRRLLIFEQ